MVHVLLQPYLMHRASMMQAQILILHSEPYVKGVFGSTLGNGTKVQSEVEKSRASVCFLIKEIRAVYGPRRSGRDSN